MSWQVGGTQILIGFPGTRRGFAVGLGYTL